MVDGHNRWKPMVASVIYLEGGGQTKDENSRCRMGFRKLLEKSLPNTPIPRLVACGGRQQAFDQYRVGRGKCPTYAGLLIDSETPMDDISEPWDHLSKHSGDDWQRPPEASNEEVLLMTTCMESWLAVDRQTLRQFYGSSLHEKRLPPIEQIESRDRHEVQKRSNQRYVGLLQRLQEREELIQPPRSRQSFRIAETFALI